MVRRGDHATVSRALGRSAASGQILVVFALSLVALTAAAGIAVDIGRFYSEQRFLQNAADAGVLAAANALAQGMTDDQAKDQARTILSRNFVNDPNGVTPALPADPPVYEPGHAGDPVFLVDGILVTGAEIRVAVRNPIPYTFGRIVGLGTAMIQGRARVSMRADVLPIVIRHFVGAPGPNSSATSPCTGSEPFQDLVATADTACLGTETNDSLRAAPDPGSPLNLSNPGDDPARHGPIISLVGQGAQASNSSSFRGFVALDIRNFSSATSNVFYNNVTAGTNANTLKDIEAGWLSFPGGYPGPGFPPVVSPPDPNDQIALTAGNSSGQIVDAMDTRFNAGDEIVAAVYSGTVMTIPDFALPGPTQPLAIGTTQNRDNAVAMTITKNSAFTGQVTTSALADANDPANPLALGTLLPITFSPNPLTPNGTVTWTTFQTSGAASGIATVWVMGHSSSPYLTDHYVPVAINVGAVARDFSSSLSPAGALVTIGSTGGTGALGVSFSTTNSNATYFGGQVALSIEDGPGGGQTPGGPSGMGTTTFSANNFTLNKNGNRAVTITFNAGSLPPGEYPVTLRATGTNLDGTPVTHLYPITLDVATAGTTNNYVDILGFAAFRITELNSNDVMGYAISPVYPSAEAAGLRRVLVPRLAPW